MRLFWEVVHSWPVEREASQAAEEASAAAQGGGLAGKSRQEKLLFFITGSDRVPILGLSALRCTIQR